MAEPDARADLSVLVDAARAGGAAALPLQGEVRQWDKDDGTPVSEGDLAADEVIARLLAEWRPGYGLVTEERGGDSNRAGPVVIVDPIDGTRSYLAGKDDWSVVLGLVEDGRPKAGVVFQPATGALYTAVRGGGAHRNGELLSVGLDGDRLVAAPRVLHTGPQGLADAGFGRAPYVGSLALRLMRLAEGAFTGVITKAGPHHWDLAAADIIVQEAGGVLNSLYGGAPRYDSAVTRHGPVVAGAVDVVGGLQRLAQRHFAEAA